MKEKKKRWDRRMIEKRWRFEEIPRSCSEPRRTGEKTRGKQGEDSWGRGARRGIFSPYTTHRREKTFVSITKKHMLLGKKGVKSRHAR